MISSPMMESEVSGLVDGREITQLCVARAVDDFQRGVDRESSFALIYATYVLALEQLFRARGLDAEACRDFAQETLREVNRTLLGYDNDARFEGWLYQIAASRLPASGLDLVDDPKNTEVLFSYLYGELAPYDAERVQEQLAGCPETRMRLRELATLADAAVPRDETAAATVAGDLASFTTRIRMAETSEQSNRRWAKVLVPALALALVLVAVWLGW